MEYRKTEELVLHELNKQVYGEEELPQDFLDSIEEKGILVPLAVKKDGTIISGHRRWRAAKAANMQTVPVNIVKFDSELDEREAVITFNKQREKTFSQKMNEAEELERIEKERARQRQAHGQTAPGKNASGNVSVSDKGETRDKVAEKTGIGSGRTYDKAKKVWQAAKSGNEKAKKEVEKLDKKQTTIHSAHKKIKQKEEVKEPPELPDGEYDVILADPPWRYQFSETNIRSIENQYATMNLQDIKDMDIPAAEDAVLYLWATAPKLEEAVQVISDWGFEYKTCAVWDKEKMGMGYWWRVQHELLLVGVRGNFSPPEAENRVRSVFREERGEHSAKPENIYDIIESMFPGHQFLELFARNKREGWEVWGDEASK